MTIWEKLEALGGPIEEWPEPPPPPPPTTFGGRLQALRLDRDWTQVSLARRAGLALGTLRGYEQDQRDPRWSNVVRLARALGVSVEEFVPPAPTKGKGKKGK